MRVLGSQSESVEVRMSEGLDVADANLCSSHQDKWLYTQCKKRVIRSSRGIGDFFFVFCRKEKKSIKSI